MYPKISVVFVVLITWCNFRKKTIYLPYIFYKVNKYRLGVKKKLVDLASKKKKKKLANLHKMTYTSGGQLFWLEGHIEGGGGS